MIKGDYRFLPKLAFKDFLNSLNFNLAETSKNVWRINYSIIKPVTSNVCGLLPRWIMFEEMLFVCYQFRFPADVLLSDDRSFHKKEHIHEILWSECQFSKYFRVAFCSYSVFITILFTFYVKKWCSIFYTIIQYFMSLLKI